jgi:hypothetical protein
MGSYRDSIPFASRLSFSLRRFSVDNAIAEVTKEVLIMEW